MIARLKNYLLDYISLTPIYITCIYIKGTYENIMGIWLFPVISLVKMTRVREN